MAEDAGEEADDGIHEDHCAELAAGEDVIADGDFEGRKLFDDALVEAFVVAGDEEDAGLGGELLDERLLERGALGREEDAGGGTRVAGFDGVDGIPDGLAHHDHAGAAAEGAVVGFVVLVTCEIADVGGVPLDDTGGAGARGDRGVQGGVRGVREELGEGGEDVEAEAGQNGSLSRCIEEVLKARSQRSGQAGNPR